ncbi:MAG: sugar phosphate nucleotidyltransferase, partial [Pseudomonadota bacterium]
HIVTASPIQEKTIETISRYKRINIIIEPKGRNTAPCIGYMAAYVAHFSNKDDVMVVLPSDHLIKNTKRFLKIVKAGVDAADKYNTVVTLGIKPTSPHTGYGYIQKGTRRSGAGAARGGAGIRGSGDVKLYKIKSFKEKPTLPVAKKFLKDGDYYWNSGIFIVKAGVILSAIRIHMPELHKGIMGISKYFGRDNEDQMFNKLFPELPAKSIDFGVIEKLKDALTIPSDFDWNDLGSWKSLEDVEKKKPYGISNIDDVLALNSKGNIINCDNKNKLIALLDVNNLIIVETRDALLIADKKDDQKIKELVERLKTEGLEEYL